MKLRIKGNSIRLRLTQREVHALGNGETVEESTRFSQTTTFTYAVCPNPTNAPISASFEHNRLSVSIARQALREWAENDVVGFEHEQFVGNGETLRLLIEKDFACLKPRVGEDDTDAYANPMQGQSC